jgi:HD-like signal output (HDOD) protein
MLPSVSAGPCGSARERSLNPILSRLRRAMPDDLATSFSARVAQLQARLRASPLKIPAMPDVALQVGRLSRDPEVSTAQLSALMGKDPAIAARMMQAANSIGHRGGGREVTSLTGAITRLGLASTRIIVQCVVMEQLFRSRSPGLNQRVHRRWQHSLETAALAEVLAVHRAGLDGETAMMAGLMHQVGVLPVIAAIDQWEPEALTLEQAELLLNAVQAEVGSTVLRRWQVPEVLAAIPEGLNQPYRDTGTAADYVDVVLVAHLQTLPPEDPRWDTLDRRRVSAYGRLGLTADAEAIDLAEAQEQARQQLGLSARESG